MVRSLQSDLDRVLGEPHGDGYVRKPVHLTPVWEPEHQALILKHIRAREHVPPLTAMRNLRTHVGVAGWFNFDVFAQGKHDAMLLIDSNRNQTDFWREFIPLLARCKDAKTLRNEFLLHSDEYRGWRMDSGEYLPIRASDREVREALDAMPWMRDEEMYGRVHEAAREGRILAADANIYDRERIGHLRRLCDGGRLDVTSIYASNIEDFNKDKIDAQRMKTLYGVNPDMVKKPNSFVKRVGQRFGLRERTLQDVLSQPEEVLRGEGVLWTPDKDFYLKPLKRDSDALRQLANSEDCQIFHSSITHNMPLIVLEGKSPLLAAASHTR
ncbi:MAG: hypothetical protein C0436_02700 [Alphaproteobacteria bacterium]|nr:hypothetical protein [Alphaproteobacteria bacterium]